MTSKKPLNFKKALEMYGNDRERLLEAAVRGKYSPDEGVSEEVVREFSRGLGNVLGTGSEPKDLSDLRERGRVYVVEVVHPTSKVRYLTVMKDGVLLATKSADGDVDWKKLREENLGGVESLDEVLEDIFTRSSMPQIKKNKNRKKPVRKAGGKGKKPPTKLRSEKPYFLVDKALIGYLREHSDFLSWEVFSEKRGTGTVVLETREQLEGLIPPDMIDRALDNGYKINVIGAPEFINQHRKPIQHARKSRLEFLVSDAEVAGVAREYMKTLETERGSYLKAIEFLLEKSENAMVAYRYFAGNVPKGVRIEEMVDVFGRMIMEAVRNDTSLCDRVNERSKEWISIAKAAEHVESDPFMKREVIPLFKPHRDGSDTSMEDEYEGIRKLAVKLTDPDPLYDVDEVGFIFQGLWAKGLLKKKKGTEGQLEMREVRGMSTQYTFPIRHLMQRFGVYEPILDAAFDRLVEDGKIDEKTTLETRKDYHKVAEMLYREVPEQVRNRTFTKLRDEDTPLVAWDGSETSSHGSTIQWVLDLYVGIKKDEYSQKIARPK